MAYIAGHSTFIAYNLDASAITESSNGTTAAALPAIPASPILLGYSNIPQTTRAFNNRKGYGVGAARALYGIKGAVLPQVAVDLRLGSLSFLQYCLRADDTDDLPWLCFYVGVEGSYTNVFRKCKCSTLTLNFAPGGETGGGELTAQATFFATAMQAGSTMTVSAAQARAFGTPLMWHDVRSFSITDSAAATADYRTNWMSQRWTVNHNLERKPIRQNWGDAEPLSRTSADILPHHINVTGETGFHSRLSQTLLTGAADAQSWGNVAIVASDSPVTRTYTVTATEVMPDVDTQNGGDSGTQLSHTLTTVATNLGVTVA